MERAELARLLGAGIGHVQEPRSGPVLISECSPTQFMAALASAVAEGGDVFLADPNWGARERARLADLLGQPAAQSRRGWLMIPTGGTSGALRFARHDEETLSAAVVGFTRHFGLRQVNAIGVLPMHHVSGLMAWMRCALTDGEYRPLDWKAVEAGDRPRLPKKSDGWVLSLVPTQLERLLQGSAVGWLRQFRIIFLGGAPAWPDLLERAAAAGLPISTGYGMTETAAMVTALRPGDFLAGVRSSGSALPHARVTIGEDGAIVIGGESIFRGYYPEWREPGDFVTQDRGRLDERGHLQVIGRRDAVIITGGEKVEPAEVEAVLRGTGQFADVVVVGVPDAEWGQAVVAAYPATLQPDLAQVNAALASLAPAKRPKRFVAIASWPVNAQGKVNRAELVRWVTRVA
jgi:O-succinylbenzoic acid--CoA ligase